MKNYFTELRALETQVCNELESLLSQTGDISLETNDTIEFWNFGTLIVLEIDEITKDGKVGSGYQKDNTITSLVNSGTISIADAISMVNDLRDFLELSGDDITTYYTCQYARDLLKENGYFTDNLWSVDDIKGKFKCTDEEAQTVIGQALSNEATMEQIWFAIGFHGEDNGLEKIEY